jgi:hypothetical protein
LTGLNFAAVQATIPSLSINQQCGAGSVCYSEQTDSTGNITTVPIPCTSELGFDPSQSINDQNALAQQNANRWRNTKILLLFLFVVIILMIIWFLFTPYSLAEENRVYQRNEHATKKLTSNGGSSAQSNTNQYRSSNYDTDLTQINSNSYSNTNYENANLPFLGPDTGFRSVNDY